MALYETSLIFRRLKKSAGKATFSQWRGMDILREKILENSSNTSAQQRQRLLFAVLMDWSGIFGEAAALGFPGRPRKQSPENAFAEANAGMATLDADGEVVVDYARIVCSEGMLKAPKVTATFNAEEGCLTFTHVAEVDGHRRYATDRLFVALLNKEEKEVTVHELNQRKDATPASVTLTDGWEVENLCIYAFYLRKDGRRASDTKYVEIG